VTFLLFQYGFSFSGLAGLVNKTAPTIKTTTTNPETTATNQNKRVISDQPNNQIPPASQPVAQSQSVSEDDLMRIAASFAERFGSYSNQSNFSNISDLKLFMSANMQTWADNYVNLQKQKNSATNIYYGITTKAVSEEVINYDDDLGQAKILVQTRRREAISSTNNTNNVFDQNITILFTKDRGAWKVDSAVWQNK
jgi:hypothetical protein